MTSFKHDPANKGIIILNLSNNKYEKRCSRYCVTFPRLENITKKHHPDEFINHSGSFKTYQQAHDFAVRYKECDHRLKDCAVWLLHNRWEKSSTRREFQRVG